MHHPLLSLSAFACLAAFVSTPAWSAEDSVQSTQIAAANRSGVFYLTDFGQIRTPKEAQAALNAASEAIPKMGGGILVIPPETAPGWTPKNRSQHELRIPEPQLLRKPGVRVQP